MTTPKTAERRAPPNKRFLPLVQSKGSLGKSFFASLFLEWLMYVRVQFKAVDSDMSHQTLLSRYPDRTNEYDVSRGPDEFGKMLGNLPETPVFILDCRANFTVDFLKYSAHYRMLEVFEHKGFRSTIPIFISDDEDATNSAGELFDHFGESADYVMVDNPKVFRSDEFRRTGLYKLLIERGAPLITIPEMHTFTKNCWMEMEDKRGGRMSISNVIADKSCDTVAVFELSGIKDIMFCQFEDAAKFLVPDVGMIKEKVTRVADAKPGARSSRFTKPSLFAKS
jgi:hypothetical protein